MKKLIVVADWANDSLNKQEFRSTVGGYIQNVEFAPQISFVSSTPSTIHTGFLLNQLTITEERYGRPQETVIFQNTDPRIQTDESVEKAKGAEFIIIRLQTGMYVCGPNAGYDFSMIKHKIDEVYHYPGVEKGSQFRSRDLFSRICAHFMEELEDDMDLEEIHSNQIPELRGYFVGHIDNHGNIKTTITQEDLKGKYVLGNKLAITINEVTQKATYVSNLFGGNPGELVIYPGSSGEKDNPFMEISVWRHFTEKNPTTGIHAFKLPKPGQEIQIK